MKSISKVLLATILSVGTSVGSFSPASAQYKNFKLGDRVEAMFGGKWQAGTVMPLLPNDTNQTGSKLRIMLDSMPEYLQPGGTEIMAVDTRAGGAQPPAQNTPVAKNGGVPAGPPQHAEPSNGAQRGASHQGATFKPGDHVEATWNGNKVTGTVIPLLPNDLNKTGNKIRVKIDGLADYLQPDGTEIMTVDAKHTNAGPINEKFENGLPAAWNPGKAPLPPGGAAPAKPPGVAPAGEYVGKPNAGSPKMIGNVPAMNGTGWKMLYDRPVAIVPTLYFRLTGRYETVGVTFGMQGSYQQNGSKLLLTANGKTDSYNMTFDPATKILRLDADGDQLKLLYDGPLPR